MANILHNKNRRSFYEGKSKIRGTTVLANHVQRVQNSSKSQITCKYVTLVNKSLTGSTTIDGVSPTSSDRILVANQTDKKQNGVYTYNDSGDWVLEKIIEPGVLITITGGTKQGTAWLVETPSFTIGSDNISIVEHSLNRKGSDFDSFSSLTAADEDLLLAEDYSDSYNKKSITLSALKTFLNYLSKAANQFANFGNVTPEVTDVLLIEDADDSFNKKNITIADLLDLVPAGLLVAEKTLYVSPTFPNSNQMFSTLTAAIAYADSIGSEHTIKLYRGDWVGNYNLGIHNLDMMPGAVIEQNDSSIPALALGGGDLTGSGQITDGGVTGTAYLVDVTEDARIEAKSIYGDYGAINLSGFAGGSGRYIEIEVDNLGKVNYDSSSAPVYVKMDVGLLSDIDIDGNAGATFNIIAKEFLGTATLNSSKVYMEVQQFLTEDTRVIDVDGADAVIKGRLENYDDTTSNTTGVGYPIIITSGSLRVFDFQAKNQSGGILWGTAGTVVMANAIFISGTVGGGLNEYPIDAPGPSLPLLVVFSTRCGMNRTVNPNVNQVTAGNRIVDTGLLI
jgi:hypothetical protein